ncbi:MAG: ferritin-like domain-containing protein [Gammaproteobacteria bacterium]|nr:ferritin-like domain-containing protein [Gammaproteobacteria bacterium]MDH5514952.1 ferritin-like domain-containing protein [Gammaproteobacteria bacterium]
MSIANTDQRVLGYLGRGLSLELSAVQLYSTQAKLVENWGLTEIAGKLSAEASEELGHAERIIGRMLALGVAPNASQLRPVKLGTDLRALLEHDYVFEEELVSLYSNAASLCARLGDQDNRLFFEALLSEEQAHAKTLKEWLQQLQ